METGTEVVYRRACILLRDLNGVARMLVKIKEDCRWIFWFQKLSNLVFGFSVSRKPPLARSSLEAPDLIRNSQIRIMVIQCVFHCFLSRFPCLATPCGCPWMFSLMLHNYQQHVRTWQLSTNNFRSLQRNRWQLAGSTCLQRHSQIRMCISM